MADDPHMDRQHDLIDVRLPRWQYERFHQLLELDPELLKQETERMKNINLAIRWSRNVLFYISTGVLAWFTFWDTIKERFFSGG